MIMEQMKLRFTNAVTNRLAAAPDSTAKAELIEELSDNLYRRYLDMTAAGMDENAAFDRALDDLGDVNELLEYLKGLAPEEELPKLTLHPYEEREKARSDLDEIIDNVDEIVKGALDQAKDALKQAKKTLRQSGQTSWHSADGQFELHVDGHDGENEERPRDGEAAGGQTADFEVSPDGKAYRFIIGEDGKKSWEFSFGHDKAKDGFFAGDGPTHDVSGSAIPSQGLRGIDVQTVNGDVTIHLMDDENADIRLAGDVDQLEVKVTDSGVLAIRQGRTASSSFFFLRGLNSADVELSLPRRRWEFIQVSAVNGDVTVDNGLELDRLSVKTTSGDLECDFTACGRLFFKSASGGLRCTGLTGDAQVETMSGDVRVSGHMGQAALFSMSGDVEMDGSAEQVRMTSMSGGVRLETGILPEVMELSSKSGGCQARIPDTEPFTLRYKTVSGGFYSDFPLTRTSRGAIYGGGGRRTYTMTSVSGDVELRKY